MARQQIPLEGEHTGSQHLVELPRTVTELIPKIYSDGEVAEKFSRLLASTVSRYQGALKAHPSHELWNQNDILLITYADQVSQGGDVTLNGLASFLEDYGLNECINSIHLLPFYPFTSDDGFAVTDYYEIRPEIGTWEEVEKLGAEYDLMFDYVVNHLSSAGTWFRKFLAGDPAYQNFFAEADPELDLSAVTRPRSTPLLTKFASSTGDRWIWTTFGPDQVDFNFKEPAALAAMLDVFLFYVSHGSRYIRLDAVNYIWKEIGTTCSHLPQAHTIVKLMRALVDVFAPGTVLISETNVPHEENISYFGQGDEAHLVYNFTLPPLVIEALLSQKGDVLTEWAQGMDVTYPDTNFFNFIASHDGIGVRSIYRFMEQGKIQPERVDNLLKEVRSKNGKVSMRSMPDGRESPYELNVSVFSLLGTESPEGDVSRESLSRYCTAHAICLALRGVPALYFHSLVGTENDIEGMNVTGRARSINRRKFDRTELDRRLSNRTPQAKVLRSMKHLMNTRKAHHAFHPDAPQTILDWGQDLFVIQRGGDLNGILSISNLTSSPVSVAEQECLKGHRWKDILSGEAPLSGENLVLEPYQTRWLVMIP